ncbi:anthranilate synthase component I family protein [Candidatus Gottesmanbacteria bacterium]|nr:anthranilate synthase component I family protein [Candidatus Gottesmanbacteria bacterium]
MTKIFPEIKLEPYQEEKIDISISAFEVFKRLYPNFGNVFLLESLGEEGKYNRYSYVGFDPLFTVSANNGELFVSGRGLKVPNAFETLTKIARRILDKRSKVRGYCGGLVGYVSYDGTKYFEPAFVGHNLYDFPCFEFGFFPDGLIFDKKGKKCIYFHHGQSRIEKVRKVLNHSGRLTSFKYKKLQEDGKEKIHKNLVEDAKVRIAQGDIFQVVLSLKSIYQFAGDNRRLYAVLRQINPSPYMIFMKFGEREIISASPELLIRVKGKRIEHLGTLAGTIKRGRDSEEDKILAQKLQSDEKEMAEHMMLVDLARNDIGKICEFGSVKVEKLATVKPYSFVQHLYTEVSGKLKSGEDAFSSLSSCFPAGTLTGAPKVEAMKIISQLEGCKRGPYGGVGGYFSLNGESMFAILIRSLFVKGGSAYTQTGSGIVMDSIPEKEYQEVINKQKAMEKALRLAQGKPL